MRALQILRMCMCMSENKTVRLHALMTPSERQAIEDWRKAQEIVPSLGEAIRQLIRLGIEASAPK